MSERPANDTIAAIATAPGAGGVGIVRLSGPRALAIAEARPSKPGAIVATGSAGSTICDDRP